MKVIDADSHVMEGERAWDHLPQEFEPRRPRPITVENAPHLGNLNAYWLIDGQTICRPYGKGAAVVGSPTTSAHARKKRFSIPSQELTDVEARLRDLDAFGIDVQVLFPSIFLVPLTDDPAFETALIRSYNRFMAEACRQRSDRLKWAAVLPMRDARAAVEEVSAGKDQGAVAVMTFGTVDHRMLHSPEFDPVWEAASRAGMPVSVHVGWSYPALRQSCEGLFAADNISFTLPLLMGFFSFTGGGILDRFPDLRVAFLEGGADWVPYFVQRMDHYYGAFAANSWGILPKRRPSEYLRDRQIYLTCEADEQLLPQVLDFVGEDRIMVSADMPHAEARESAVEELRGRADLSEKVKAKILFENPVRFYNL